MQLRAMTKLHKARDGEKRRQRQKTVLWTGLIVLPNIACVCVSQTKDQRLLCGCVPTSTDKLLNRQKFPAAVLRTRADSSALLRHGKIEVIV